MKNGKSPTREQSAVLKRHDLDPAEWLVVKNMPEKLVIVNKKTIYSGKKPEMRELQRTKI